MAVETGLGLAGETGVEGDELTSAPVELGFDPSPCAIISLGNQERITKQLEAISSPSLGDGAFAMGAAASTEDTS